MTCTWAVLLQPLGTINRAPTIACWATPIIHVLLQNGLARDAGAGVDAETVAATNLAVGKDAAAAGGERSGAGAAAAGDRGGRRAERDGCGRERADVLRIGAPVERLIAELQIQIARGAHEIDARRIESGRGVGFGEIKEAGAGVGWIGDGNIEPAVGGLDGDRGDGRRRGSGRGRIDAGGLARGVHGRDNFGERFVEIRIAVFDGCELCNGQHGRPIPKVEDEKRPDRSRALEKSGLISFYAAALLRAGGETRRLGRLWRPTKTNPTQIALNRSIGNSILASPLLNLFQDQFCFAFYFDAKV